MRTALAWSAILFAAFWLVIDLNLIIKGGTGHIILAVAIFALLVSPAVNFSYRSLQRQKRNKQNAGDDVIAAWEDLRMTSTELIEGYSSNAARHPLAGLTATVDTSGSVVSMVSGNANKIITDTSDQRLVHLTIEGPETGIVRSTYGSDATARRFATVLNLASRHLQGGQPPTAASLPSPIPPPSVPAGWYPDPTNGQLQRYWDGTGWSGTPLSRG